MGSGAGRVGDWFRSRMAPYVGVDLVNISVGDANVELQTWIGGLREDAEIQLAPWAQLRTGIDMEIRSNTFDSEIPVPRGLSQSGSARPISYRNNRDHRS